MVPISESITVTQRDNRSISLSYAQFLGAPPETMCFGELLPNGAFAPCDGAASHIANAVTFTFDTMPIRPAVELHFENEGTRVAAQRRIPMDGLTNFRDAGGYRGRGGGLPWGTVFRSENLARVTERDRRRLEGLGIRRVVDLRLDHERTISPTPVAVEDALVIKRFPIFGSILGTEDAFDFIRSGRITHVTIDDMVEMYLDLIDRHLQEITEIVAYVESFDDGATLVHCTAGKDRTGIVIALLQLRGGVSEDSVRDDYYLSNLYRTPVRMMELDTLIRESNVKPMDIRPYLTAPERALEVALNVIAKESPALLVRS